MPNGKPVLPGKTGKTGKKRKWHSLIDKVYALPNLRRAWEKVRANGGAAGADGMTLRVFGRNAETLEHRLNSLSEDLRNKTYRPQPVRRRVRSAIVGRTGSGFNRPITEVID